MDDRPFGVGGSREGNRPLTWSIANLPFPTGANWRRLLGSLRFFGSFLLRPGCRDIPAQGLTPPLHLRKGFHPLTRFR